METDPAALEKSDQVVISSSDEQSPGQAARYQCTFCKRGFTNAQALGGHMNIHRKDKAKLKKASNEAQQVLVDIPKTTSLYPPLLLPKTNTTIQPLKFMSTSEEEKVTTKWPWISSSQDDHATSRDETHVAGEPRKLQLFDETKEGFSSSHGSSGPEVDLELRLGNEPQDSSATQAIKKFF